MAELVPVRLKDQDDTVDPGLMPRAYFEKYGKDKGYVEVKDEAAQAAAASASAGPDAEPAADEPATRKGR